MRGVIVYKIQFINALTKEILREEILKDEKVVREMIKPLERNRDIEGHDVFLVDNRKRMVEGKFVSYTVGDVDDFIVFRLLFSVKLAKLQPLLKGKY
jgi:hypothetical protein